MDHDSCAASGTCTSIAPEFFELGTSDDVARVLHRYVTDAADLERILKAVDSCPTFAISIDEASE